MIQRFTAKGFRNLRVADLELGRVNVLLGPNNCGKSNLLDALTLGCELFEVRERERGRPLYKVVRPGDFARGVVDPMELGWTLAPSQDDASPTRYDVRLARADEGAAGAVVEREHILWQVGAADRVELAAHEPVRGSVRVRVSRLEPAEQVLPDVAPGQELLLNAVVLDRLPGLDEEWRVRLAFAEDQLRDGFARHLHYRAPALDLAAARGAVVRRDAVVRLDPQGVDLANVLRTTEQLKGGLDAYAERLRDLVPDLERVWTREAGDRRWLVARISGQAVEARELSDGTVQAMLLAWLLFHSEQGKGLVAIDEPELNLHPAWQRVVARWIQNPHGTQQLAISTHSPELLDPLTEGFVHGEVQVFVFREPGVPHKLSPVEVAGQLEQGWQLGDLYRVGAPALGGWPW